MQTVLDATKKNQLHPSPHDKLEFFLDRLAGVQTSRDSYRALCPAHDDNHPSLEIKIGYKGILLRDWSGCSLSEILQAMGLTESDLFYDEPGANFYKKNGTRYAKANLNFKWNWRKQTGELLAITTARGILAKEFLNRVKSLGPETLSDAQKDFLLEKLSLAWSWIQAAESASDLSFAIAQRQRHEEANHG